MKRILLSLSILIFAVCGCKIIDELTHFDVDYNYTFTLLSFGGLNPNLDIGASNIENSTESTFENNDTRKDLVERATLKKFNVKIVDPVNGNFSFVDKVEIFINTEVLDEKLIAWKNNIPNDIGNTLELETISNNLKKYLTSDEIGIRLKTTSSTPLTEDITIDLKATVEVDAKILGI